MKNIKIVFCLLSILISQNTLAQKKILDHPDFDIWNRVRSPKLSAEGDFIIYSIEKGEKDQHIKIKDNQSNLIFDYECCFITSSNLSTSFNSEFQAVTNLTAFPSSSSSLIS